MPRAAIERSVRGRTSELDRIGPVARPTRKALAVRLPRHRRTLAATAVVAAVLSAGACGTSFDAQTNQQYQAAVGADDRAADVQVLHALLVVSTNGGATLSATLVNKTDSDQRLTSATLVDGDGNELELVSTDAEDLEIAPGQARTLGQTEDAAQQSPSKIYTTSGIEEVGLYFTLTLSFDGADDVEIAIPSVTRTSVYADVALPPGADPGGNLKAPGAEATKKNAENEESL